MRNHALWMLIGCAVPVILIFLFPLIGIGRNWTLFIFIVLMFGCHLLMMKGHKNTSHGEHHVEDKGEKK